ncbi:MAG: response regulator transcription factor [Cellulosilyticaceae bacterium]
MSDYKILLVDDEEEIRKGIIKKINWSELGFQVVGEAENGIEALDIIDKTSPDLVLTDIRMPFMDGIKLAENIRDRFPTTKVVVLSGFDDFEYAQAAIKLGVIRYILKPINASEMKTALLEIKQGLDEEIASKNDLKMLKVNYEKSLPLLRERFFNQWIEDYIEGVIVEENIQSLKIDLPSKDLMVAVIRLDYLSQKELDSNYMKNKNLLKLAVFNMCEEIIELKKTGIVFMRMNELVVIATAGEIDNQNTILQTLEEIRIRVEKYLSTTITIGVGTVCTDKSLLYKSYLSAVSAFEYSVLINNNRVIYIGDIEPNNQVDILLEEKDERSLFAAIKVGHEAEISQIIEKLLSKIDGSKVSLKNYQLYIIEILSSILKLTRMMEIELSSVLSNEDNFLMAISGFKTKEEIKKWLGDLANNLSRQLSSQRDNSKNDLIEKAKEYIQDYYAEEELNEDKLCQYLHISTNYFSTLFKKEVKSTFTSYLTRVRIEKAKELLRHTQMKNFKIGQRVGYGEPHYFSYVFKKTTGISPTEYRNGKD